MFFLFPISHRQHIHTSFHSPSLSFRWKDVWNVKHGRSLKRAAWQKVFIQSISVNCRQVSSLSFTQQSRRHKETKSDKLGGRREGGRGERERERDTNGRAGRVRNKRQNENVKFDVIVCMWGFAIFSRFDWQIHFVDAKAIETRWQRAKLQWGCTTLYTS